MLGEKKSTVESTLVSLGGDTAGHLELRQQWCLSGQPTVLKSDALSGPLGVKEILIHLPQLCPVIPGNLPGLSFKSGHLAFPLGLLRPRLIPKAGLPCFSMTGSWDLV